MGDPDVAVTVVFKPKKPVAGPVKVVSVALFVDAPVFDCSNSWAIIANTNSSQSVATLVQVPLINSALTNG